MEIESFGIVVNRGAIEGKSGSATFFGAKFEHRQGRIGAAKVEFGSDETILAGAVVGREGFFHGKTTVAPSGEIDVQRGVVDGLFVNASDNVKFERRLDLVGERAEVQNGGGISTAEILSDAAVGILNGGRFCATTSVRAKKHLQIGANFPRLTSARIDADAKLLIKAESATPRLRKIVNAGDARILSGVPALADLQNAASGRLQLESSAPLERITSLDRLRGALDIKASLPNLTKLNLPGGASLTATAGSDFSALTDVRVQAGATLLAEESSVFSGLKNIANFGTITSKTRLANLDSIYNAPNATARFLERAVVKGRATAAEDLAMAPSMGSLRGRIGVFNEGKMLVEIDDSRGEFGVDVTGGNYVASENAIFRIERGGIRARDFLNDGILYSPTGLKFTQHGRVTKWGRGVAEDGIEYEIDAVPLDLDDTFQPIINGANKTLRIKSKAGLNISGAINWNVDLDVETPIFNGNADLTVRTFRAKTEAFANGRILSARDSIDIETRDFTNTSGRLQTHGSLRIKADGLFRNTGGGRLEKDKPETLTYYTWSGSGSPVGRRTTIYRDVYHPDLGKAGVIASGGLLDIRAGRFDNSFGILNAARQLDIGSRTEVGNECGLIYSAGPTSITGTLLKNGYMKGEQTVSGIDPNAPIRKRRQVTRYIDEIEYIWHPGKKILGIGPSAWTEQRIVKKPRTDIENVTVGYGPATQRSSASQYPGYIFSEGDLRIGMSAGSYLGTMVSGGDIYIKGAKQKNLNFADRGLLIARGDVNLELQKAALAQLAIQARNIRFDLTEELLIRGIVLPVLMPDGSVVRLIDLQRLGERLGFLADGSTFASQGSATRSPTGFVPMQGAAPLGGFSIHPTAEAGFMGERPGSSRFMPTVQDRILNQLITLTLAPLEGRDVLLNVDLVGRLRRAGAGLGETFRGSQNLVLPGGDPAILFDRSANPDAEVEIDGETVRVPLYNPHLICDAVSRLENMIRAERLIDIRSLGDIRLEPGEINLRSEDLNLESQKQIQIAAEFTSSKVGGARDGVRPVVVDVPGTFSAAGRTGATSRGAQISARTVRITSAEGDVTDMDMPLDPVYTYADSNTILKKQTTVTSSLRAKDRLEVAAPKGTIEQRGTEMVVGSGGAVFEARKHVWSPAFEEAGLYRADRRSLVRMETRTPKASLIQTPGTIIFKSKDTTLVGAQIVAGTVSNPEDGTFRALPARGSRENYSYTVKRGGFCGLGKSTMEIHETGDVIEPTRIIAEHFESLGAGICEFEGVVVRALDMTITKNLEERAAYERSSAKMTQRSSGFFAPKIKGDPFAEALRSVRGVVTFGDAVPTAANLIGATAQTLAHAEMLANLSTMQNPFSTVTAILLGRFVTGPVYSDIKVVNERRESRPVQSRVETGVLHVSNDRTRLEGVWNVDRARIETRKLTTAAPKHAVEQTTETSGWSVSLSPAALFAAGLAFVAPALAPGVVAAPAAGLTTAQKLACLPNVAVCDSDGSSSTTTHVPTIMNADDLFIRCDDAVFSGSTIRAKTLEAIVSGDLTVETLADMFRSESSSRNFSVCLGAVASLTQDAKVDGFFRDPRLGAIPTIRIADEERLSLKVQELAKLVGTEKFYLTVGGALYKKSAEVGLRPDGVVVRSDAEKIQAGRVLEEKVREVESRKRRVINPCVGEFVAMMGQIDEFQQVRAKIAEAQALQGLPIAEREKTNREVKEFLDKPEVRGNLAKQKAAERKLAETMQKIAKLEAEDPTLRARAAGMPVEKPAPPTRPSAKSQPKPAAPSSVQASPGEGAEMVRVLEFVGAEREKKTLMRSMLDAGVAVKKDMDAYAASRAWVGQTKDFVMGLMRGAGYGLTAGALGLAAYEGGALAVLGAGAGMVVGGEVFAAAVENGGETLVNAAVSLATTKEEAVAYADFTISCIEAATTAAVAVGTVVGAKSLRSATPKVAALRTNFKAKAEATFLQAQAAPVELEAGISRGISAAVETNPLLKMEMTRLLKAPKMHRHHIFPREFRPFFERAGISIDEHCMLIPLTSHLTGIHGKGLPSYMPGKYNQHWKTFFKENPTATQREIYQFGGRLIDEFGLTGYTMTQFK